MKVPLLNLFQVAWECAAPHRTRMVFLPVIFLCAELTVLTEPYFIGQLLNCVQSAATAPTGDLSKIINRILLWLALLLAARIGFWAFHGPGRVIEMLLAFHLSAQYRASRFKMLTELPLPWHKNHHSGESIDKISKAAFALETFFSSTFELISMVIRFIGAQIILMWVMPSAGIAVGFATVICIGSIVMLDRKILQRLGEMKVLENKTASAIHDYVTNIVSIITLRLENRVVTEVIKRLQTARHPFGKFVLINETKWCITSLTLGVTTTAVLAAYCLSALHGNQALMAGTFFALFEYLRKVGDSFNSFAYTYGGTMAFSADVLAAQTIAESHAELSESAKCHALPLNWSTIELRNLTFTHSDDESTCATLTDISMKLQRGKKIALVGPSGSGKSTLLKVLRGTLCPQAVSVACDGNFLESGLQHIQSTTTLLPQDPEIFADTIKFNITFGLEASCEKIAVFTALSHFQPVLKRLPQGLDTDIAEKGLNLSGGEKQKLALARGLFFAEDSDILLLDEPTSSIDQATERAIYNELFSMFSDKCIISSVHRLHLLELFDYVYVLENGRIVSESVPATLAVAHSSSQLSLDQMTQQNTV